MEITSELSYLAAMETKHTRSHKTGAYKYNIAHYDKQNWIHKAAIMFGVDTKTNQ